ncbi:hypothetical protein MES4922_10065 [Mesorhizobium ventifaucium]|uniref:Uncharacterized protein n=1 Tax=Mesorhizobium ventifaucium TaxID=666020 RepID=A0ABN8JE76_9HYPH|nr:hypothetical protein MES4922_10065 [Mesorhizobium ventifaucium]
MTGEVVRKFDECSEKLTALKTTSPLRKGVTGFSKEPISGLKLIGETSLSYRSSAERHY